MNAFLSRLVPIRVVVISLYLSVIVAKFVREYANTCTRPVNFDNDTIYIVCLVALIGLELFEAYRFSTTPTLLTAVGLILLRILLIEVVRTGDCTFFYGFLYLIPPLIAYWYLSPRLGYFFGAAYFVYYIFRQVEIEPAAETIDELLIYGVGLVFTLMMANMVRQAERTRDHAKEVLRQLEASQNQVAELAATEERNRLARNIHDSLGHYLTVVGIQLDKALAYREIDSELSAQAMIDAKRAADNALEDVRESVSSLREESSFSLNVALQNLVETNRELPIDLEIEGEESRYSHAVLNVLYRAVQEGLTNIHKHAHATEVHIRVVLGLKEAKLVVEDDGEGFDTEDLSPHTLNTKAHFGLQGLRERLELVGGNLSVDSKIDQGTTLNISIPRRELMVQ